MPIQWISAGPAMAAALVAVTSTALLSGPAMADDVRRADLRPLAVRIVHGDHHVGSAGLARCHPIPDALIAAGLQGHNALRRKSWLPRIRANPVLSQLAADQACDMARRGTVSHADRAGRPIGVRAAAAGYHWRMIGENLAAGAGSIAELLRAWQVSPGHRANIMNRKMREFGLGRAVSADGKTVYWAAVYARPG